MTDQPDSLRSAFIPPEDEGGTLGSALTTRHLEAFGRKVTSTASHLIAPNGDLQSAQYQAAVSSLHRELRRPATQRRIFAFSQTSPSELVRSKLSTAEIQTRALASLPDEMLADLPEDTSTYSLFQGFKASVPESDNEHRKSHRRRSTLKAIEGPNGKSLQQPASLDNLRDERDTLHRRMEMMGVRKNMCSAEIKEIDNKVFNLQRMRDIVLDRLAGLEIEESDLEQDLYRLDSKIELEEELQGEQNDESATPKTSDTATDSEHRQQMDASFMSESVYGKLPSPESTKSLKQKPMRAKRTNPILHSHFEPGSRLREIPAHSDYITAIDFDVPFGTMVSAALDDTLRVWDLNSGRCTGFLEGHAASVRCIQVEENIVATGSMDASVRLWDLSQAKYLPRRERVNKQPPPEDEDGFEDLGATPPKYSLENCPLFSLEAHMDEVTAIHFQGDNLISGSADKTLRQWDLQTGRCVQTLDVLWAAAQADTFSSRSHWRPTGRLPDASADFVGALQCFESALACGTADGMIRLWDLRSGQVHRSLVGHTGPVTCLQFDSMHLVTGSADRSIRIWDLRTGAIYDAYAYDNAVTSMMFDQRRIVAAAGEDVVKVYDKTDGHRWDCGMGALDEKDREYSPSVVEKVRIRDGYLVEGRRDGVIGTWTC